MPGSLGPSAYRTIDHTGRYGEPGTVYRGGVLLAAASDTSVLWIYDGNDATGAILDRLSASPSALSLRPLTDGIIIRVGLYIVADANIDRFTLYYDPPSPPP